jgi:hypothetical protein
MPAQSGASMGDAAKGGCQKQQWKEQITSEWAGGAPSRKDFFPFHYQPLNSNYIDKIY